MNNRELNTGRTYGQPEDKELAAFLIDVAELFDKFETASGNAKILGGEVYLNGKFYVWNGEYFVYGKTRDVNVL